MTTEMKLEAALAYSDSLANHIYASVYEVSGWVVRQDVMTGGLMLVPEPNCEWVLWATPMWEGRAWLTFTATDTQGQFLSLHSAPFESSGVFEIDAALWVELVTEGIARVRKQFPFASTK